MDVFSVVVGGAMALLGVGAGEWWKTRREDRRERRETHAQLQRTYLRWRHSQNRMRGFLWGEVYDFVDSREPTRGEALRLLAKAEDLFDDVVEVVDELTLCDPDASRLSLVHASLGKLDQALIPLRLARKAGDHDYTRRIKGTVVEWIKLGNELMRRLRADFAEPLIALPAPSRGQLHDHTGAEL